MQGCYLLGYTLGDACTNSYTAVHVQYIFHIHVQLYINMYSTYRYMYSVYSTAQHSIYVYPNGRAHAHGVGSREQEHHNQVSYNNRESSLEVKIEFANQNQNRVWKCALLGHRKYLLQSLSFDALYGVKGLAGYIILCSLTSFCVKNQEILSAELPVMK